MHTADGDHLRFDLNHPDQREVVVQLTAQALCEGGIGQAIINPVYSVLGSLHHAVTVAEEVEENKAAAGAYDVAAGAYAGPRRSIAPTALSVPGPGRATQLDQPSMC